MNVKKPAAAVAAMIGFAAFALGGAQTATAENGEPKTVKSMSDYTNAKDQGFSEIAPGVWVKSRQGSVSIVKSSKARQGKAVKMKRSAVSDKAVLYKLKSDGSLKRVAKAQKGKGRISLPSRFVSTEPKLFLLKSDGSETWVIVDSDGGSVNALSLDNVRVEIVNWVWDGVGVATANPGSLDEQFYLRTYESNAIFSTGEVFPWSAPYSTQTDGYFTFSDDPNVDPFESNNHVWVKNPSVGPPTGWVLAPGLPVPAVPASPAEGKAASWLGGGKYYYLERFADDSCQNDYKCYKFTIAYPPKSGMDEGVVMSGKDAVRPMPPS